MLENEGDIESLVVNGNSPAGYNGYSDQSPKWHKGSGRSIENYEWDWRETIKLIGPHSCLTGTSVSG